MLITPPSPPMQQPQQKCQKLQELPPSPPDMVHAATDAHMAEESSQDSLHSHPARVQGAELLDPMGSLDEEGEEGEEISEGMISENEENEADEANTHVVAALLENLHFGSCTVGNGEGLKGGDGQADEVEWVPELSIEDIRIADDFIHLLCNASLDTSGLDTDTLFHLRNPLEGPVEEPDSQTRLSLDMYLSITHASKAMYTNICEAIL
ncbi:hypothetical protein GYMLUDRAFT_248666 [Collybiopsis luxurians FD-317 M1]|uniref:Uncharacterized protein n=1 Tax=Collybiopsis luxurians FD-317 M1 TaxID=944289 RepID=A0A0D0AXS4_9AGAR|nr:hypothetical protein GYMLUDRAFT_248666 [Collybiopsis luxurians FD-317 M1]